MALDVNVYADKKDYELELEVSDAEKVKTTLMLSLKKIILTLSMPRARSHAL